MKDYWSACKSPHLQLACAMSIRPAHTGPGSIQGVPTAQVRGAGSRTRREVISGMATSSVGWSPATPTAKLQVHVHLLCNMSTLLFQEAYKDLDLEKTRTQTWKVTNDGQLISN